jgi:hypothetical protein
MEVSIIAVGISEEIATIPPSFGFLVFQITYLKPDSKFLDKPVFSISLIIKAIAVR